MILTIYRVPRRVVRKLTKPARLWFNAWLYKQTEYEVERLEALRTGAIAGMQLQRRRQVFLQMKRGLIAGW